MSVALAPGAASASSTPDVQPPVAEFLHAVKTYVGGWRRRCIEAVRDVSLRIEAGEVFGLLGPNRAGKTTLLKMLLSLCQPTSGTIRRLDQPIRQRSTLARVGYVHENHAFPRYLSAAELLEYYGALAGVPAEVLWPRIRVLLERFGLADRSREPIARFSKGMLQRLGMAQALLNEPQLLVLDEPTEGLDLPGRELLRGMVAEIRQRQGSVLLVSHVLPEVEQLCDRVGVLVGGRLVHVGPLAELLEDADGEPCSLEQSLRRLYATKGASQ